MCGPGWDAALSLFAIVLSTGTLLVVLRWRP